MGKRELKVIRLVLAIIWLVTAVLSFGIYPVAESLKLLERVGLTGALGVFALYGSASLDLCLGLLTLFYPKRQLWLLQAILIIGYSVIIAFFLPEFWPHPFGPVLKNLPILVLLWLLYRHQE